MGFYDGNLFGIMFTLVFVIIIGTVVVRVVRSAFTWNKNNHSPRLCTEASIVSKRSDVHHYHHGASADGMYGPSSASTTYYVCFQFESGDRLELKVSGSEYGMLAEGDHGKLSFQGTRYLGFERDMNR